jgi:broad specificity phosphatase PhoE
MKQTHIGLLRHAPTGWNAMKRIQGQYDVPLPQESYEVIDGWIPSIMQHPWTRILTSDLSRAYFTALALNKHLNIPLREIAPEEVARQEAAGWEFTPPSGESRTKVLNRTLEALHDATLRWEGENILIVTHYGNIAILANHLMHKNFLPEEGRLIEKHALHRLVAEQATPESTQYSVLALNEVL